MDLKRKLIVTTAAIPIVLLLVVGHGPSAQAYWGPGFAGGWNSFGHSFGDGCFNGCGGGYQAGISDAIYDHDNNLQYNPIGQCLPCHSDEYWSDFHEGYDHQWNTYQSQESNQGSSINIYGNNNYVSTSQYSNQQQNPLQQLGRVVCGLVNCNGGPGYEP